MKSSFILRLSTMVAVLAVAMGIGPALAADLSGSNAAPDPVIQLPGWEGTYLGATSGVVRTRGDEDGDAKTSTDYIGGVFAGYNAQTGKVVYGVEGELGYNGLKASSLGADIKGGVNGAVRGRLGYAVNDRLLIYTAAGLAAGRYSVKDGSVSDSRMLTGWTAGVGADVALTDKVFARGEYRYTNMGSIGSNTFETAGGPAKLSGGMNEFRIGLGVRF